MPVDTPSIFSKVIEEHLALKRRNAQLEDTLPLERYLNGDPFENHPLFKTEEQARIEETMDGEQPGIAPAAWPGQERIDEDSGLWARPRDFDWGD